MRSSSLKMGRERSVAHTHSTLQLHPEYCIHKLHKQAVRMRSYLLPEDYIPTLLLLLLLLSEKKDK